MDSIAKTKPSPDSIQRTAFTTSRLMDFFSQKELVTQTGHDKYEWPLVCLKELLDNSLDACEEAGIPPVINVTVDATGITVTDNGPGIPADTVAKMLDYSVRVSSREAYVSPTRGAQGNALKTLIAMPFVLDGTKGYVTITTWGILHEVWAEVDRIKQEPVLTHEQSESNVKTGTIVHIVWPNSASSVLEDSQDQFLQMAQAFAFLNPHLHLTVSWYDDEPRMWSATDTGWKKWSDNMPSSAHWYDAEKLDRLIAGYVSNNPEKSVREFIAEFRGLKGTAKQKKVLASLGEGVFRSTLKEAFVVDGAIDREKVEMLLAGMREHSTPPAARLPGLIGKDHLVARLKEMGCDMDTFGYQRMLDLDDDGMPSIAEVAFAMRGKDDEDEDLIIITGVNWSSAIGNPFKKLGKYGTSMDGVLAEARVSFDDPVVMLVHMACPSVKYSDHGKSSIVLED